MGDMVDELVKFYSKLPQAMKIRPAEEKQPTQKPGPSQIIADLEEPPARTRSTSTQGPKARGKSKSKKAKKTKVSKKKKGRGRPPKT